MKTSWKEHEIMVIDEDCRFRFGEFCRICGVPAEEILEMIDEGLLRPSGDAPGGWTFSGRELKRVQITMRLQRDLRVNLPGCALVLQLLEELEELRARLGRG